MIIYKVTNLINGKIYIGQTTQTLLQRKTEHLKPSKKKNNHFHNALCKHGINNFKWEIICICPNMNILNEQEKYYIAFYDSMNNGYNLRNGGLNSLISKETKKKMSIARLKYFRENPDKILKGKNNPMYGRIISEETKNKISKSLIGKYYGKNNGFYGKKHTKESLIKMGNAHRGFKHTEESIKKMSGKNNHNYGKKFSKKTKEKMRQAQLGKKHSEITKKKLSKVRRLRIISENTKEKTSESMKKYWRKKNDY